MALGPVESLLNERNAKIVALGPPPSWWHPFKLRRWRRQYASIMATDVTTLGLVLRDIYSAEYLEELTNRKPASFAMIGKARRDA